MPLYVRARFDLATLISDRGYDVLLDRVDLPVAPNVGETVNLKGYPFVVIDRGWALDENRIMHCHVRVVDPSGTYQHRPKAEPDTDDPRSVTVSPLKAGTPTPSNGRFRVSGVWNFVGEGFIPPVDGEFTAMSDEGTVR